MILMRIETMVIYQNDKERWDPTTLLVIGRGSVGRDEEKQKGKVCFLMLQSHN